MWHRLALAVCLACTIAALPLAQAFAQAVGTAAEQKLRSEIESVFTGWLDALNNGDGRAAAMFFVPGAPMINPAGVVRGDSQDYVNRIEQQRQRNSNTMATIERVQELGSDAAYATGPYTNISGPNNNRSHVEGNWLQVFERRGGGWKIGASTFTQVGPAKPGGK
jgi:ketosteroid isomerase-like protein